MAVQILFLITLLLFSPLSALAQYSPAPAPSPSSDSSPSLSPSPSPLPATDESEFSPSPGPSPFSSPAPSPSNLAPISPSPGEDDEETPDVEKSSPPWPDVNGDINHANQSNAGDLEKNDDKDKPSPPGGMSGGKKAGVVFGVIAAACVVGLGAFVYKKRRQNIRRSQYAYTARRDFL